MFTPEFVSSVHGEFVLVANHCLESDDAIRLSIEYNRARIAYGRINMPDEIRTCRVIYDARGQRVTQDVENRVRSDLQSECILEFRR